MKHFFIFQWCQHNNKQKKERIKLGKIVICLTETVNLKIYVHDLDPVFDPVLSLQINILFSLCELFLFYVKNIV